jgi:hypothetical protein
MGTIATETREREGIASRRPRAVLPLRARHALLTAHIVVSVALLGDSAGYLAVASAPRRSTTRSWFTTR